MAFTEDQIQWINEAERRGVLSQEQQAWVNEARSRNLLTSVPRKEAEDVTWDLLQKNAGRGLTYLGDPTGFGEWLADQEEDLAGYRPQFSGEFLESQDKFGWIKERGLENAAQTALPYAGFAASALIESIPSAHPAIVAAKPVLASAINSGIGLFNYIANAGDVGSDYEERMKSPEIHGKDYELDGTDKMAIAGISTIVSAMDYFGPNKLDNNPLSKELLKKSLIDIATKDPRKFAEAVKGLSKEGVQPFLKSIGIEMGMEGLQKGVSMAGADIAAGDMRSGDEYASSMLSETMASVFGATTGVTVQTGANLATTKDVNQNTQQAQQTLKNTQVSDKGAIRTGLDIVADTAARKSVSVLDPWLDLPAAQQLRDTFEHREFGDAPGVVKPRDFFETKLNELGDLYNQVDAAVNRLKDNITGRFITPSVRNTLNSYIGTPPKLDPRLNDAVNKAKSGDMTGIESLKGSSRKKAETVLAAYQIKETVSEIENRFSQLGIKPAYSKTASGIPLFFNTKEIKKNSGAFDAWLQGEGYASSPVHAQEIREGILETGGVPYIQQPRLYKGYRPTKGKEKPGVVNKKFNADTVPSQFVNKNIDQALPKFAMKAATRIAHAKQFGPRGEKVQSLVNQMIDQARAQGRTIPTSVIDRINDLQDALIGNFNPIRTEGVAAANKAATVIQAASTLGGATLSSLQEPLVILERAGLLPTLQSLPGALNQITRGLLRGLNKKFINQSDMMRVAEEIGIAQEYANAEILTQSFSAEHANLLDAYFKSPFGLFLYQWTRFVRSWATGAGMFKFNQYQRELNAGKLSKLSRDQLADLGISVQDLTAINNLLKPTGLTIRDLLIQNAKQPNVTTEAILDATLPSGLTGRDILRGGLVRMVNETVMAPRATIRPMWLNDPHYAMLGALKSFPITFGNTVIKRMLRKLNPKRMGCSGGLAQAMGALSVGVGLVGVAYMSQQLKHMAWGRPENAPKYKPTIGQATTPRELLSSRFAEAVQQAGLLGAWQFAVDAYRFEPSTTVGPMLNDVYNGILAAIEYGEGDIETADIMEVMGQRIGKTLGVLGKSKDTQEGVGEFFRDLVE